MNNDYGDEQWVYVYSDAIPHKDGYEFGYATVDLWVLEPLSLTDDVFEAYIGGIKNYE